MFSSPPLPSSPPSQMAYILQVHWYIGYPLKAIGAKAERDLLTCLKCACVMAFVIVLSFEKYHVLYYVCTIYSSSTLSYVASIVVQLHHEEQTNNRGQEQGRVVSECLGQSHGFVLCFFIIRPAPPMWRVLWCNCTVRTHSQQ